jgi:hypothetical protein
MRVEKLLKRLKREFLKVNLLQASLDSLLFFLSANLFLFLFSLNISDSLSNIQVLSLLTGIFFFADLTYRAKHFRLEIYEQKNPELREILRTARDNLDRRDIVSQAMFDDLMERSRSVTSESIIPSKKIIQKVLAVGILSFMTVLSGIADFQILQQGRDIISDESFDQILNQNNQSEEEFELKNGSEILGERKDIEVSDELINFSIEGQGESDDSDLQSDAVPEDVRLDTSGPSVSEDVELAKQYSLAIKQFE